MPTETPTAAESAERRRWAARARTRSVALAGSALAVCALVMAEWIAQSDLLISLASSWNTFKFNSALLASVLASALLVRDLRVQRLLYLASLIGTTVFVIGYVVERDFGLSELFVDDWTAVQGVAPGRPSGSLALCLAFVAVGGILAMTRHGVLAQACASASIVISLSSGYAYLFGLRDAVSLGTTTVLMPATGVVVVLLLSMALLYAIPGSVAQWVSFGTDTGAQLQRALFPLVLTVVPAMGYLVIRGAENGWFDVRVAVALATALTTLGGLLLAGWVGLGSRRLDTERDALLMEIKSVNAELEDRVRVRSHEVNRQRTKLALLEERDRIARDLHDRVIQRIFAAGLQIGGMSRTVAKLGEDAGRLPTQLDGVATELDLAIRELRNSIFQLTSIDDHQDLEQVVRDIATRSARILGFMPRIETSGDLTGVRSDLGAHLASAIQEGLSNVARHARASAAEVVLEGRDDEFVVRISDDGIGLPDPLPRSSGISNLMSRARSLGGEATWTPREPSGTVFTWRIPRDGEVDEFYGNDVSVAAD